MLPLNKHSKSHIVSQVLSLFSSSSSDAHQIHMGVDLFFCGADIDPGITMSNESYYNIHFSDSNPDPRLTKWEILHAGDTGW